MHKRFIKYLIKIVAGDKTIYKIASFDTLTQLSTYVSDFKFKPDELQHW